MNNKAGFSLVELSIVLVIITIVIGGIFKARELVFSSKINAIFSEATKINNAIIEFEKTYSQLPGDMYNSDVMFKSNTINGDPATTKGNGDGVIVGDEGIYAFQHLALAGVLEGNYNGVWTYNNMYKGPFDNSVFYLVSSYGDPVVLRFAKVSSRFGILSGAMLTSSALTVAQMIAIDEKYDDGKASSGNIIAYTGSDVAANSCVDAGGNYNLTYIKDETLRCYFDIRIKHSIYGSQ